VAQQSSLICRLDALNSVDRSVDFNSFRRGWKKFLSVAASVKLMAQIVLVHGIYHQYLSRDQLETTWIPALAGGLRIAGHDEEAERIRRGAISVQMAFYGHLFRPAGAQGVTRTVLNKRFAEALAAEWLKRATASRVDERRLAAERELFALQPEDATAQGGGRIARSAVNGLMHVPWIGKLAMKLAENFLVTALSQVTAYFCDEEVRRAILNAVDSCVGADTMAIIGHSLGSVIAFEACHRSQRPIALLVTLGSPIGLRTVVYDNLTPQPPSYPKCVGHWLNLADIDDVAAVQSELRPLFSAGMPAGARMTDRGIDNGADAHNVTCYLNVAHLGRALAEVL
jgi:hypothetical protein